MGWDEEAALCRRFMGRRGDDWVLMRLGVARGRKCNCTFVIAMVMVLAILTVIGFVMVVVTASLHVIGIGTAILRSYLFAEKMLRNNHGNGRGE